MFLWKNDCLDPYRNMATEEYLLMTAEEPCVMLWRNSPAVVIGKNQDARAEVDFAYAKSRQICVVRRLSGGGAVFHDTGNVNYTFIVPDGKALDFSAFAEPVTRALSGLGIRVERAGRNDLVTVPDAGKCSGTAECIYNRKNPDGTLRSILLHHGTLLFDADVCAMSGVLTPDKEKLASKAVRSVKSRVVNLKSRLAPAHRGMTAEAFKAYLEEFFLAEGACEREFSAADRQAIEALAENKYATQEWLLGRFGEEEKTLGRRFCYGSVCVTLHCAKNKIEKIRFTGDFFGTEDIGALEAALTGAGTDFDSLLRITAASDVSRYIFGAEPQEIAQLVSDAACAAEGSSRSRNF